jgi:Carboxypeptidase regulatory-like domain
MLKRIIPVIAFLIAMPFMVMAQITTSSISGTVTGTGNEVLAGASITATHLPSGTKYSTISRTGGVFNIQNMRVGGPYVIEITFVGYKAEKLEDITLQLAETFQLAPVLSKNDATLENVVVSTTRRNTILNAGRTGAVTNVGRREITVLPSISRSINDIARVTPQASSSSTGAVAGGNYRQNNITVDGSDFNNSFGIGSNLPAQGSPISLDAIEEISVSITPFDVRQSGFIGSALNAVTRSGTNKISGSAYTYWRSQNQSGNKVGKASFKRQKYQFNQYGARVGGPIIKNKLFFFLNYETEKTISPGQQNLASTPANPFGSASNIARPTTVELDAIRSYLSQTYEYETGPYDNYDFEGNKTKMLARLDWNITSKHKFNFRYSQVESSDPSPMSGSYGSTNITGQNRTGLNALWFKNSNYYQDYNFYSYAGELNSAFSSRVSNTLRFSYNRQDEPRSTDGKDFPLVDIMKDGSVFTTFGYEPFSYGNFRDVKIYSAVDNLTISAGKHNLLIGLQADFTETLNGFQPFGASYYRFNSWADFIGGVKPLDFVYTYSLKKDYSQAVSRFKFAQYSALLQDEITVSKQFKLTLGIRADKSTYPSVPEVLDNPLVSGLTFNNGLKVSTGTLPKSRLLLSPRIGFNFDVYGDRSLQLRGGTGIFTGRVPYVWIVGQSANSGMIQVTQAFNGQANTFGPFNSAIGFYRPAAPPPAGSTMPTTVTAFSPDYKMPQTWKTSFAFDVKLPGGIIGTLEAIYNRDYNNTYSRNVNLVAPAPLNTPGTPDNRLIYPSTGATRSINRLTTTGPGIIVPSATGTTELTMIVTGNEKRGHYASLTARLEKQFRGGFSAMIAYAKSFANTYYDGTGDQPVNTWNGITTVNGANNPELSYAGYIVPDRLIATLSFRKEYLKHLGTTISFFYEGAIDNKFSYTYSTDFNRDGANADLIYIPKDARNTAEIQFVPTASINGVVYSAADQGQLFENFINQDKYLRKHRGQYAERNGAKLPWRSQLDFKFLQDVFVNIGKSRNTLQFSVDIFNFANLLNKDWSKRKLTSTQFLASSNNVPILVPQNVASLAPGGTVVPTFRLNTDRLGQINTKSFIDNVGLASTYFMQFGLRYLFN